MTQPVYELKADLDGDGIFETDWSAYLKGLQGLSVWRESALDAFGSRTVTLLMDNEDKRFSPKNTAGPYSPDLKRGIGVQLKATVTTPAIVNLYDNPSYETDINGATASAGILSRQTATARYGEASLRLLGDAAIQTITLKQRDSSRVAVTTGLDYTFSCALRFIPPSATFKLVIRWYDSGDIELSADTGSTFTVANPWTRESFTATAPASAAKAQMEILEVSGLTIAKALYVDGVMFEQASSASLYCDGDQPGATWASTPHQSASSRGADPQFPLFTGMVRSFSVDRAGEPLMGMNCTGFLEDFQTLKIDAGPFQNKPAIWIIQRLFDIMTRDQKIDDGGFISPISMEDFTAGPGAAKNGGLSDSAKGGGADPDDFASMEGDNVRWFQTVVAGGGEYFELDLTSRTNNTDKYDLAVWVGTNDTDMDGLTVQIKIEDDIGIIHTESIVLDDATLTEARVLDKQYSGGATARRIRFYFPPTMTGLLNDWFITGLSFTPSKYRIARAFNPALPGAAQWDNSLEYLDAFNRSALATLEEALRSTGAWFYEAGDGGFYIEDFDQRSPAAIPKLRLTDTPIGDGLYVSNPVYNEPVANIHNRIRVASFGAVTLLTNTARTVWAFEPLPRSYAANRRVLVYVGYISEEAEGGLIARRAVIRDTLGAGNYDPDTRPLSGYSIPAGAQPYLFNRGRAGVITFQTDTAIGLTLDKLTIEARAWHRSTSERVFVDKVVSGTEGDEPRELVLETPAQGYKTQLMTDLAAWAARYGTGLSTVQLEMKATTTEYLLEVIGRQPGLPVRYRQVTGPGASMADELYYVEGWKLDHAVGSVPRMTLLLEEAA